MHFLFLISLCLTFNQLLVLAQDFKSRFVQDDFLPIPLSAPLAADSSVDGEGNASTKQDPRCQEAPDGGNGTDEIARFFFNPSNHSCSSFTYTGAGGNQNNFLTEIDCLNNCYIDVNEGGAPEQKEEDVHMISQEADLGDLKKKHGAADNESEDITTSIAP